MQIVLIIVLIILLPLLLFWVTGFLFANDFTVPTNAIRHYKKVAIIFPHADDEVLTAGGLIAQLSWQGSFVTLLIATKGERGTPNGSEDKTLKAIRTKEAQTCADILGVHTLIQKDFGDGQLHKKIREVTQTINDLLRTSKPDLVITYDRSGLYGHEDHIVVSDIVTTLIQKHYPHITLWYASLPKRILSMITLPEHMAKDPAFAKRRLSPTHKVFVGSAVWAKIRGVYSYKSQFESFQSGLPFKPIPPWFFYSMQLYEYFAYGNEIRKTPQKAISGNDQKTQQNVPLQG